MINNNAIIIVIMHIIMYVVNQKREKCCTKKKREKWIHMLSPQIKQSEGQLDDYVPNSRNLAFSTGWYKIRS